MKGVIEVRRLKAGERNVTVLMWIRRRKVGINHVLMPALQDVNPVKSLALNGIEIDAANTVAAQ